MDTILQDIQEADPIRSSTLVAGMLIDPLYHANTIRLELLIHYLLSHSDGKLLPSSEVIQHWLNNSDPIGSAFYIEDPVEDVFVANVMTQWGDFRIYNGVWEGNDFYLQKVLDTIQSIPTHMGSESLLKPIHAILCLSEEVARRRQAELYQIAESHDKEQILVPSIDTLEYLVSTLTFSRSEIEDLRFSIDDLTPFIFDSELRKKLKDQEPGNTDLERFPILVDADAIILILPTAISISIRRYTFGWLHKMGLVDSFEENYVRQYIRFLQETPILGEPVPTSVPLSPYKIAESYFIDVMRQVDTGRYIHIIVRIDTLHGILDEGMVTPHPYSHEQSDEIERRMLAARDSLRAREGFKDGLSLIVSAGYGRPAILTITEKISDWNFEFISAHDLETISWFPEINDTSLWKLLDHRRKLAEYNVKFINVNGLLNLYSWWEQSDYLLVPEDTEIGKAKHLIFVPTDSLAKGRQKTREASDLHSDMYIDGNYKRLRRKNLSSHFDEDKNVPLYACYQDMHKGELLGCAVTKSRPWWVKLGQENTAIESNVSFKIWDALHNWMHRISSILDSRFSNEISGPILFELDVSMLPQYERLPEDSPPTADSIIDVQIDHDSHIIKLKLKELFLYNLHNPFNISEIALVRSCIQGFFALANYNIDDSQINDLCSLVVPNNDARFIHFFEAYRFRDRIRVYDRCDYMEIDKFDAGFVKIGLGHLDGVLGYREIVGKSQCNSFLENIVKHCWENLKRKLKEYNRESLITASLRNIEGAAAKKEEWQRSARAILGLHDDKVEVHNVIREQFSKYHAAVISCRIIIEMAICESPIDSGEDVGHLDLSPLMSMASLIFHMGNLSDAIHKDVTEPRIIISPSGDIITEQTFYNEIITPFFARFERTGFISAADRYEKYYEDQPDQKPWTAIFSHDYLDAFEKETGVSAETLRRFREELENLAEEKGESVLTARISEIIAYCENGKLCSGEDVSNILKSLSLQPRKNWEAPPSGYIHIDINPWLFRRRLSLLMKPFVKMEDTEDPRYIISPGFTGEALAYMLDIYNKGNIEETRCNSPEMRKWVGEERNRRGHEFNKEVASALKSLGYKAEPDIKISTIISKHEHDKDYGDIDVLAWSDGEQSIYVIECKDLYFAITYKEVAEQLLEFKGEDRDGKPDRLKKHLLRIDILSEHKDELSKFCNLDLKEIKIVPYVIFSNPVPVLYATSEARTDVRFECLQDILEAKAL